MTFTEAELKAKSVKDLKELCKQVGAPVKSKKEDIVAALLAAQAQQAVEDDVPAGLEELEDVPAEAGAAGGGDDAAAAADGKHASIVFKLDEKKVVEKKANLVGVVALSDSERAALRVAKFGGAAKAAPAGAAAAGGGVGAAPTGLAEEIKRLERGVKYGKASDADVKKLEGLRKKLAAQEEKQRLALDKVELQDPDRMAAREKKFGRTLIGGASGPGSSKDIKDPDALKKRAAKFGKPLGVAPAAGGNKAEDEARKKARLERFAKSS